MAGVLLVGLNHCDHANQSWIKSLPTRVQQSIVLVVDHEEGDMSDWTLPGSRHPGRGIFNTGGSDVRVAASQDVAHSGSWSAKTTITNAIRGENGNRAVRLMCWTDAAFDSGGKHFPDSMYYSTWVYIPHVYDPSWWNIFQFKSNDENGDSRVLWVLDVKHDDQLGMYLTLFRSRYVSSQRTYRQANPIALPFGQWVHIEAFYHSATGNNGRITIWQDNQLILDQREVVTSLGGVSGNDTWPTWGIGNYTSDIDGDPAGDGTATIYFDDVTVSALPTSTTTPEH